LISDSWIALKLEAQFADRYLMPSVLMTSTMKSEPGTPPMRKLSSFSPGYRSRRRRLPVRP
jgi:hypothetical protein